jgi:hypothetical protein
LLNAAERLHSGKRKKPHGNSRRAYPFWKTCQVCSIAFPCLTKEQATRNKTCSWDCARQLIGKHKRPPPEHNTTCAGCGKSFHRALSHLARTAASYCSRQCNGQARGKDWAKHAHKGRAAWSEAAEKSYRSKMSGPNNPAWKGGIRRRGGYVYVRCPQRFKAMARPDGYIAEHRLIVARALGRTLTSREVVHHINHDPADNRLCNLSLFRTNADHKLFEAHGSPEPLWQGSSHSTTAG